MEQSEASLLSIHDDTVLERACIPRAFRELATLTESVCLSRPLDSYEKPDLSGERRVVAALGSHGLRMAIELVNHMEFAPESDSERMTVIDIVRRPDLFTHESYPEAITWAEAFGAALLDEAYETLGADADQYLEKYRAATTVDEQLSVIAWLDERLSAMKEELPSDAEPEDYLIYHPIRLAPKAIGKYPDISLPPTCLGVSIIAASFLRKAGAETMHAGVMATVGDTETQRAMYQAELSSKNIEQLVGSQAALSEALIQRNAEYADQLLVDRGYHAAVLTRLIDGTWCQIDPNFKRTTQVNLDYMNKKIQQASQALNEFALTAPELEIGISMDGGTALTGYIEAWHEIASDDLGCYYDRIEGILIGEDDESVVQRLHECIVDAYHEYYPIDGTDEIANADRYFRDFCLFEDTEVGKPGSYYSQQTHIADSFAHLLHKYVFYEESPAVVMDRCRSDEAFRGRRVEDVLAIIPALRATSAETLSLLPRDDFSEPHDRLEVGRTETRIGFSVLSDVASYMPNDLPATFWHATWPSLIPVTERSTDYGERGVCRAIHNMSAITMVRSLQYLKDYYKITDTMSTILERG